MNSVAISAQDFKRTVQVANYETCILGTTMMQRKQEEAETEAEPNPKWLDENEDSDVDEQEVQKEMEAAEAWFLEMKVLLISRTITAQQFCTLIYHAAKAGSGLERYAKFGKKPWLRKKLPMYVDAKPNYELDLAINRKDGLGSETMQFQVLVPQEELEEELASIPTWKTDLRRAIAEKRFPKAYEEHPIVQASTSEEPILPIAIFIDGVPYSNIDTIEGYWIINMLTNQRHFVCGLRKLLKCKCGCKGWRTQWEILNFLNWAFESLATGRRATNRHDNKPWQRTDALRQEAAGKESIKALSFTSKAIGPNTFESNLKEWQGSEEALDGKQKMFKGCPPVNQKGTVFKVDCKGTSFLHIKARMNCFSNLSR